MKCLVFEAEFSLSERKLPPRLCAALVYSGGWSLIFVHPEYAISRGSLPQYSCVPLATAKGMLRLSYTMISLPAFKTSS